MKRMKFIAHKNRTLCSNSIISHFEHKILANSYFKSDNFRKTAFDILDGRYVRELRRKELSHYRNREFGGVFKAFYLLPRMTADENMMLPMKYSGLGKRESLERAGYLLYQVGLENHEKSYPGEMSRGEKQRVAIARALANDPRYILADEPTGNLDRENRNLIIRILADLNKGESKTIIMVTHDRELLTYAGRVIQL